MKKILLPIAMVILTVALLTARRINPSSYASAGWQQGAGPLGGTVTKMLTVNGKLWAALYSGGIYELRNGTWTQIGINHGLPENRTFDIVPDPVNTQNVYAGQMIACGAKSGDGGASWLGLCDNLLAAADSPNFSSFTLAIDPDDSNTLYLPGHRHDQTSLLLVSTDGGATWGNRYTFPEHLDFSHLVFFNNVMYLATRSNGVYVSTDKGASWTTHNNGLGSLQGIRLVAFKNHLYLVGGLFQFNVREGGALYRLSDDGTSWSAVAGPKYVTGGFANAAGIWIGGEGAALWKSSDGTTFSKLAAKGLPMAAGFVGEIVADGNTISVGLAGTGIFRSTDAGKTFAEFNTGLKAIATREVHVNPKNANQLYVVTWDRLGMYYSKNGGASFTSFGTDYNFLTTAPDPQNFRHFYAGGDRFFEGTMSKSKVVWTEGKKPGPAGSVIKALAVHPKKPEIVFAGIAKEVAETPPGYGLYYSVNRGRNWKRASGVPQAAVYSILFDPKNTKNVYASALSAGVYKSTNSGKTFARIGGERLKYSYRLAMDPSNPNHLVAGSQLFFAGLSTADQISGKYGGLFETKDGGTSWTELTAGIRNYGDVDDPEGFQGWKYNFGHLPNYEQILIDPKNPKHITVGHHGESVVSTTDGGVTWQKQGQGMIPGNMHNYAYCLGQSKTGNKIYSCTCGRGLFSGTVSPTSGQVAWQATRLSVPAAYAQEVRSFPQPKNAGQARTLLLLSGAEYNHPH